ncbi:MAG: hypothetical protein MUF40_04355 [Gemmatimonadaceae bacterium]|jgi:hypothetical protein|nr:hypothetical protein [Gemmatimonadaceae bacterium]
MTATEISRPNGRAQRAGCAVVVVVLVIVGGFRALERTGLVVNVNQGWNALGSLAFFRFDPAALQPGAKPALDSALLADANVLGAAVGTPYVAVDSYHVHLPPRADTTGMASALVYVVRDARGARSSFALPLSAGRSGVWVDHLQLRRERRLVPAEGAAPQTPACVHAREAAPGRCLLVRGAGEPTWTCRCSSGGTLVP